MPTNDGAQELVHQHVTVEDLATNDLILGEFESRRTHSDIVVSDYRVGIEHERHQEAPEFSNEAPLLGCQGGFRHTCSTAYDNLEAAKITKVPHFLDSPPAQRGT